MANSNVFHLYHYILDLTCNLDDQTFSGSIILFLNPITNEEENRQIFSIQEYQRQMKQMCENGDVSQCKLKADLGESAMKRQRLNSGCDIEQLIDISPSVSQEKPHQNLSEIKHLENSNAEYSKRITGIPTTSKTDLRSCGADLVTCNSGNINEIPISKSTNPVDTPNPGRTTLSIEKPEAATLILDACDIEVISVHELDYQEQELINLAKVSLAKTTDSGLPIQYMDYCTSSGRPLRHLVEKWCIKIWKDDVKDYKDFPRVVRIQYSTKSNGASLRWVLDQDEK